MSKIMGDVAAQQAAQEYMASRPLQSSGFGGIDYKLLAEELARELRESPIVVKSEVKNDVNVNVDLDHETVGRKTVPVY